MIAGPNSIFICEECVQVAVYIFYEERKTEWDEWLLKLLSGEWKKEQEKKLKELEKAKKIPSKKAPQPKK